MGTQALAIIIDAIGVGIIASAISAMLGGDATGTQSQGLSSSFGPRTSRTYVGAFLRYVGFFISCVVFLLGVIWAAFDAQKQRWHDKIAGTYVVKA